MKQKLSSIIIRAMKDPAFKAELIEDPKKVLSDWDIDLPADCRVQVLEQSLEKLYVVLPTPKAIKEFESVNSKPQAFNPLEDIVIKAVKDPVYKEHLIRNTKKILELECDIELPPECVGEVVEESDRHFYLVIPYVPDPGELSDHELSEIVAGVSQPTVYTTTGQPFSTLDMNNSFGNHNEK